MNTVAPSPFHIPMSLALPTGPLPDLPAILTTTSTESCVGKYRLSKLQSADIAEMGNELEGGAQQSTNLVRCLNISAKHLGHNQEKELSVSSRTLIKTDEFFRTALGVSGVWAGVGAVLGGMAGFNLCPFPFAATIQSIKMGVTVGTTVGAIAGLGYGTSEAISNIDYIFSPSNTLEVWKKTVPVEFYAEYLSRLNTYHPELDDFLCPLSLDFIVYPVRTPDGRVYEYRYIKQWIEGRTKAVEQTARNGSTRLLEQALSTINPFRGECITLEDLKFDATYHLDLSQKMFEISKKVDTLGQKLILHYFAQAMQTTALENLESERDSAVVKINSFTHKYRLKSSLREEWLNLVNAYYEKLKRSATV